MNAPMKTFRHEASLADMFLQACELDVRAFKPGNVSFDSPGHNMSADDFLVSAFASAPHITDIRYGVGEKIFHAVEATRRAVGCNTNLGIILLAAPLVHAAQYKFPYETLADSLRRVLASLTRNDASWAYRAIRLASPGGLGTSRRHDVRTEADSTLLEAMREAAYRDRIAYQYANSYADILHRGRLALHNGRNRWQEETGAITAMYLDFLAAIPDSHVLRKHGPDTAEQVMRLAKNNLAGMHRCSSWTCVRPLLEDLDQILKSTGINPGTSADLTVATWLADRLMQEDRSPGETTHA